MNDERNQQQEQERDKNPTLDAPGSQVADYGNPTGGSANDDRQQQGQADETRREPPHTQGNETLGNP